MKHCLLCLLIFVCIGCGGPKMAPVEGVVTLNGQPLVDATVTFTPTQAASDMNLTSFGRTDNEGKYSLETMMEGKRGALVGKHSVRIALNIEEEEDADIMSEEDFKKAELPEHDFQFDVTSGSNEANFDL